MARLRAPRPAKKGKIKSEVPPPRSDLAETSVFSFKHLKSDWCITLCDPAQLRAFATFLRNYGKRTWGEIRQSRRESGGFEPISPDQFSGGPIPTPFTEESHAVVFRFHGDQCRVVGFLERAVFHIVWVDTNLSLYDHG